MALALNPVAAAEPDCLMRWRTTAPTHEVRILRSGQDFVLQLYNTAQQTLEYSQSYGLDESISTLGSCYRRWCKRDAEVRVFRTGNPKTVHCIRSEPTEKRVYSFVVKELSEDNLLAILACANPIFMMQNNLLHIWFGTPDQPVPIEEVWKPHHEASEMGIIHTAPNGDETELIRTANGMGLLGQDDVRVIRKRVGARESLVCEVFDRAMNTTRIIPISENNPQASIFDRILDITAPQFASLKFGQNNLPERVVFTGPIGGPFLFAEGRNLSCLSLHEIEQIVAAQLKFRDINGDEVSAYNVRKFSVTKKMYTAGDLGKMPYIFIHIERNPFVRSAKPIISFLESLLCIGNWKMYQSYVSKPAMEDQIFRPSQQSDAQKKEAWEAFKKTFIRCGIIEIRIACDRTWGELDCGTETLTMKAAKFGQDVRQAPRTVAECFFKKKKEVALEHDLPYRRPGQTEFQHM